MKLRVYRDSIRLRLTPAEVHHLRENRELIEETHFPDSTFHYALRRSSSADIVRALFDSQTLSVEIPDKIFLTWADSDEIQIAANESRLNILIEKDFSCLNPTENEPGVTYYPNPREPKRY